MGELEVRGPWVASQLLQRARAPIRFTRRRLVQDRRHRDDQPIADASRSPIVSKDLVKSGGEWISSVALETALMGHPAVAEAAVIAVPHPKWDERPLAVGGAEAGARRRPSTNSATFLAPRLR